MCRRLRPTQTKEYKTIKHKLKTLGFTIYGFITAEDTTTLASTIQESDVKAGIIAQFAQNISHSFSRVILCDDSAEALIQAEKILSQYSLSKLNTVHIKSGSGFEDKSIKKYQRLFTTEDYRKYDGEGARKLKKVEVRLETYGQKTKNYYDNTIMGNISLFFNKTHVQARLQM